MPGHANRLETGVVDPTHQLEDPESIRIRDLSQLARLLADDLITRDEYDQAKKNLFKQKE